MQEPGNRATPENRGADAAARYRGTPAATAPAGRGRPRHILEVEDYLLAGWIVLVEYALRRMADEPVVSVGPFVLDMILAEHTAAQSPGWLGWLASLTPAGWAVLALFLFVLLTRGPEDTDRDVAIERRTPMLALLVPVLSLYALVASAVQDMVVGITEKPASGQPPWPGPYVPGVVRRTAAVPLALLGDAMFRSEIGQTDLLTFAPTSLVDAISPRMLLVVVASAFPFMIFVAGPRIAAGAALAWRPWILRFVFFYASAWAGGLLGRF